MELEVRNTAAEEQTFEEALHTYFAIGDIRQVSITGL
jgi:glucose-6-phosphate 1-epimerase